MAAPTSHDMERARRVLKLRETQDYKITYSRNASPELVGYSDSDWAGSISNRRSTSG